MSTLPNSALPTPDSTLAPSPPSHGRPRSLDETKRAEICTLVKNGSDLAAAARYVGCNVSTVRREARRNPEFAQALRAAERQAEFAPLNAIHRAAQKSWRAGAYLLERNEARRDAAKDARHETISQLRIYNHALGIILNYELRDEMLRRRLSQLLGAALNYTSRELAAGRKPFGLDIYNAVSQLPRSSPAPNSTPAYSPVPDFASPPATPTTDQHA